MLKALELINLFGFSQSAGKPAILKRKPAVAKPAVWQYGAFALLCLSIIISLSGYMVSVNSYAASGYEIKQLKNQLAQLEEANQKLNFQASRVSSMVNLQSQLAGSDFVPAGTPQFLYANQLTQR